MNANQINQAEKEDNFRLNKAKEHMAFVRNAEAASRAALAAAIEDSKRAKEKYEALFAECEKRAVARRRSGLVAVSSQY